MTDPERPPVDPPYQPCCTDATGMPVPCQHPPVEPLREAARRVSDTASVLPGRPPTSPRWLVSDEAFSDLRAALASPAAPRPEGLDEAADRLRDAISGERRDWHTVEVRPDEHRRAPRPPLRNLRLDGLYI